jgi:hypothetical protein
MGGFVFGLRFSSTSPSSCCAEDGWGIITRLSITNRNAYIAYDHTIN